MQSPRNWRRRVEYSKRPSCSEYRRSDPMADLVLLRSLRFGSMTPSTSSHRRHRAEGGGQPGPKLPSNSDDWSQPLGHRNSWRDLWFSSNPNSWKSNGGLLRQPNFGALSDTNFISAIVRL